MFRNSNNEIEYTLDECIEALQKLIKSESIEQKRAVDLHALEMATRALEAEYTSLHNNRALSHEAERAYPHIITTLSYHASHDMAYIYPDEITKAVLTAGRDALLRKQRGR